MKWRGSEYLFDEIPKFPRERQTKHKNIMTFTQQNGVAEENNWIIVEMARS